MELSFVLVLLACSLSSAVSRPVSSDVISKDSYKRQILQPIPGYIPVYIQTDVPIFRKSGDNSRVFLPKPIGQAKTTSGNVPVQVEEARSQKDGRKMAEKEDKVDAPKKTESLKTKEKRERIKSPVAAKT